MTAAQLIMLTSDIVIPVVEIKDPVENTEATRKYHAAVELMYL